MALCSGTVTSPSLPFDLITEILSRLPVKLLLQLRCVCKSWNSLISDLKFAQKHLNLSTTHSFHCLTYGSSANILSSCSFNSVFTTTNVTTTDLVQLEFPWGHYVHFVGSCNGILCLAGHYRGSIKVRLWNPSIRKFKELPSFGKRRHPMRMHGFGYDMVSDNYKVVAVFDVDDNNCTFSNEVEVHTLGTNSWKSIPAFPYGVSSVQQSGQCVSGAINWLVYNDVRKSRCFIVSLDLRNESYEEVLMPDYDEGDRTTLQLSVFRYSLCFISGEDVWIMKEYGNKESWTKLFTISLMGGPPRPSYSCVHTIHIFENDQVLLEYLEGFKLKFIIYNCKNDTSKFNVLGEDFVVCFESLISPYSIS